MATLITLAAALEEHRARGAGLNSYESYRKDAHARGYLFIGGTKVPAEKRSGRWMVDAEAFATGVAAAVTAANAAKRAMQQAEADYEARKLHPQGARLSWGSYHVSGAFHFVTTDYGRMRMRSNGGWLCNACWQPASTENNRPECHTCSDWNGCGTDCTLSRVFCVPCGTSLEVGGA
jgi:hypothetical protein